MEKNEIRNKNSWSIRVYNLDSIFYKEYEFIEEDGDQINHGIIDLMIENDSEIILIDYKLKNMDDVAYHKQLTGYQRYIERKTKKKVVAYLYSLVDHEWVKISEKEVPQIGWQFLINWLLC